MGNASAQGNPQLHHVPHEWSPGPLLRILSSLPTSVSVCRASLRRWGGSSQSKSRESSLEPETAAGAWNLSLRG